MAWPSWRQEVPNAGDTTAACKRPADARRGAALAHYSPRSQVSSLLCEVSAPARGPYARSSEAQPGSQGARGGTGRGARPSRPRLPPLARGVGAALARAVARVWEAGGQVDGRAETAPRPAYNSFPSPPPSQGCGCRRNGLSRAPAGRRRHLLPHRLPGFLGERAALPSPASRLETGPRALPFGQGGTASSPDGRPGSREAATPAVPTRGPGGLGLGGEPQGIELAVGVASHGPSRRISWGSLRGGGFHPWWTSCHWQTIQKTRGWVGHPTH